MSLILGILDSGGAAAGAPGSYESIATVTVGSGGAANVEFTSIPATYTHLQIRGIAKNSSANPYANNVDLRLNSDTGSNYAWHLLYGVGTSPVGVSATTSTTYIAYAGLAIGANTANVFGVTIIDILDYKNTNKYKTVRALTGANSNTTATAEQYIGIGSGLWQNTNAITTITLTPNAGNFTQYSQFALYGIKGA
jgi:hypothetical protein